MFCDSLASVPDSDYDVGSALELAYESGEHAWVVLSVGVHRHDAVEAEAGGSRESRIQRSVVAACTHVTNDVRTGLFSDRRRPIARSIVHDDR
jgi:hypothetical protein